MKSSASLRFAALIPIFLLAAGAAAQTVTADRYEDVCVLMDLNTPWGGAEKVELVGICTTETTWDAVEPGSANDSDGNGRDDVPIELVALSLKGFSSTGPVTMTVNAYMSSLGEIEELSNITPGLLDLPPYAPPSGSPADSFFDVFVEVDLDGFRTHNREPMRMTGHLSSLPAAHVDDLVSVGLVSLYDINAEPTGIFFGVDRWTLNPYVENDVFGSANATITLHDPMGLPYPVTLTGGAQIDVFFTGDAEGLDDDSDGDGLDDASMKFVSLNLAGISPTLGDVSLSLYTALPSLGEIEEMVNMDPGRLDLPPFAASGTADSFFDVFTEISVVGTTMHNTSPLHVGGPVTYKPVGEDDILTGFGLVSLLDEQGASTGWNLMIDTLRLGPLATGVSDDGPPIVRVSALHATPNPFNPATTIHFSLGVSGHVRVQVLDMRGRLVRTLLDEDHSTGPQKIVWDGTDAAGHSVPSGIYMARLIAAGKTMTTRLALVK